MARKRKIYEIYKIPDKIDLLGTEWIIEFPKKLKNFNGNKCLGQARLSERKILLENGQKNIQEVFFHELAHILDYLTNIGREKCDVEIFANTSALFWRQAFNQIPLLSIVDKNGKDKKPQKKSRKKTIKSRRKKKNGHN